VCAILAKEDGIEVSGEAGSLPEMMARVNQSRPDIVLLNLAVGGANQPGFLRQVKELYPDIRIVAVTMADGCEYFFEVPRAGASSYIISSAGTAWFLAALREPARVERPHAGDAARQILSGCARQARERHDGNGHILLTGRERQVLELVADGHSNEAVAVRLGLRPSTIRTHRANIMAKLGLPNRTDMVKYALSHGLVTTAGSSE